MLSQKQICIACIQDKHLGIQIKSVGMISKCDYCHGEPQECIQLDELSEKIYQVISTYFVPSEYNYELYSKFSNYAPPGIQIRELIETVAGIEDQVVDDTLKYLSEHHDDRGVDNYDDQDPYGDDSYYKETSSEPNGYATEWNRFCRLIKNEKRYLNKEAESILENIFRNIHSLRTSYGNSVIFTLKKSEKGIFRARIASSNEELKKILSNPHLELAAPPANFAKNGRMSPLGISVFYGAGDVSTCMAELRAPVGSDVVIGEFELERDIQVLDLGLLQNAKVDLSYFKETYKEERDRIHFLKNLVGELIKPIMPGDEELDYLPTQFIAAYLENHQETIDGILFNSSQTSTDNTNNTSHKKFLEEKNLVLFHKSSRLDSPKLTFVKEVLEVYRYHNRELFLLEEDLESKTEELSQQSYGLMSTDSRISTLRLDPKDISVYKMKGIQYSYNQIFTNRVKNSDNLLYEIDFYDEDVDIRSL